MDIKNPPEHIEKAFRRSLLEDDEWGLLAATRAYHEFEDLRRYALAMEQLIDCQERSEVEELTREAEFLNEDDRGEFWAWHYPAHWDQVVRGLFRASTITAIVSFLETTLVQVCRDVRLVTGEELRSSDLQGGAIEKSKKYLIRFGRFSSGGNDPWKRIEDIVRLRNVLVHVNGEIDTSRKPEKVRQLVDKSPGLEESMGYIAIGQEYLEHCLTCAGELLFYLSSEMRSLCARSKQFESSSN